MSNQSGWGRTEKVVRGYSKHHIVGQLQSLPQRASHALQARFGSCSLHYNDDDEIELTATTQLMRNPHEDDARLGWRRLGFIYGAYNGGTLESGAQL